MRYDAIIVGARVAGSTTGMLLARKGMKVLLVDKASFPSDTLSTHYIHASGIARLNRWGLLERLRKTRCPAIRCAYFDFGPFGFGGTPPPAEGGIKEAYAPRRTVLDKLLADAAIEAGCELQQNCRVKELLSDRGKVMGIRAKGSEEFADIVIGADGPHSMVARSVDALAYDTKPALTCIYYAYWSGVELTHAQLRIRPKHTTISFPTHDGLTLALVSTAISEYPRLRLDHEKSYLEMMPEEIRAGRCETRVVGTADLPNFYRKPFGAGWALVGDAGYDRDPLSAQGISDALRDAELLSAALLTSTARESALAECERRRNTETRALYDFTCQRASYVPPTAGMLEILAAISKSPEDACRFAGIDAGTVRYEDFFHPESIERLLGR